MVLGSIMDVNMSTLHRIMCFMPWENMSLYRLTHLLGYFILDFINGINDGLVVTVTLLCHWDFQINMANPIFYYPLPRKRPELCSLVNNYQFYFIYPFSLLNLFPAFFTIVKNISLKSSVLNLYNGTWFKYKYISKTCSIRTFKYIYKA